VRSTVITVKEKSSRSENGKRESKTKRGDHETGHNYAAHKEEEDDDGTDNDSGHYRELLNTYRILCTTPLVW